MNADFGLLRACPQSPNDLDDRKVDFFKVPDIVTIFKPVEKEHHTNVNTHLKPFYDHCCGARDILKKSCWLLSVYQVKHFSV